MGLLDKVISLFGVQTGDGDKGQEILAWLDDQGGAQGIIEKFRNNGLGDIIESWVGSGNNLPVSAEQIAAVFGSPALQQLADKLGINIQGATELIREYLPKIIDGLSPGGQIAEHQDLLTAGLDLLKGKLQR